MTIMLILVLVLAVVVVVVFNFAIAARFVLPFSFWLCHQSIGIQTQAATSMQPEVLVVPALLRHAG